MITIFVLLCLLLCQLWLLKTGDYGVINCDSVHCFNLEIFCKIYIYTNKECKSLMKGNLCLILLMIKISTLIYTVGWNKFYDIFSVCQSWKCDPY